LECKILEFDNRDALKTPYLEQLLRSDIHLLAVAETWMNESEFQQKWKGHSTEYGGKWTMLHTTEGTRGSGIAVFLDKRIFGDVQIFSQSKGKSITLISNGKAIRISHKQTKQAEEFDLPDGLEGVVMGDFNRPVDRKGATQENTCTPAHASNLRTRPYDHIICVGVKGSAPEVRYIPTAISDHHVVRKTVHWPECTKPQCPLPSWRPKQDDLKFKGLVEVVKEKAVKDKLSHAEVVRLITGEVQKEVTAGDDHRQSNKSRKRKHQQLSKPLLNKETSWSWWGTTGQILKWSQLQRDPKAMWKLFNTELNHQTPIPALLPRRCNT